MSNEWYTPSRYIEAARLVMGGIDLDPASCSFANETVKAAHYYTKEDNGLMRPWYGRVWLNPPYGKTMQGGASYLEQFTRHLITQHKCGNTQQAILLIPVNTATRWFPVLWDHPICFPDFRIHFYTEQGTSDSAAFGTCFVYLGPDEEKFAEVFSQFGRIVKAIDTPKPRLMTRELWAESEVVA